MVMKTLDRKLVRDMSFMKAQIFTIALVVAIGIGVLIGFITTYDSLKQAQLNFYQDHRFSHVFAQVKRAPLSKLRELEAIPGIVQVEARIVQDALLTMPSLKEPAVARVITIPDGRQPLQNKIFLKKGRLPLFDQTAEIVVGEAFANANQVQLGSQLTLLLNGKERQFQVVGVGISPEYVFALGGSGLPDDKHFGVFWLNNSAIAKVLDMEGAFNSLTFFVSQQISQESILSGIDTVLDPYGGFGSQGRKDQSSHMFLEEEFLQLEVHATVIPIIFLLVAVYLLNVVMSRLIHTQRLQIATLRALGYSKISVAGHYVKLSMLVAGLGSFLGGLVGLLLGHSMTDLYMQFYHFPELVFKPSGLHFMTGLGTSALTALWGVYFALQNIFKLTPAEAMRPPSPALFHESKLESSAFFGRLNLRLKMIIRGLALNRLRTLMTIVGMSFSLMMSISGSFWQDTIDHLMKVQFSIIQRETARVVLAAPMKSHVLSDFKRLPGVITAEGYRSIPVKLHVLQKVKTTAIIGLPPSPELWGIINKGLAELSIPEHGVLMSKSLAKAMGVKAQDKVVIEILEGAKPTITLTVDQIVDEFLGMSLYMNLEAANALLGDQGLINMVSLRTLSNDNELLYSELKKLPVVSAVSFKKTVLDSFYEVSGMSMLILTFIIMAFSGIITVGIVYNNARVSLAERDWELATLRILGFTKGEVFYVLMGEIFAVLLLCIPLGWILGVLVAWSFVVMMSPEAMQIPFVIYPRTFTMATFVLVFSGLFTSLFIADRVRKLDLVATLKSRS